MNRFKWFFILLISIALLVAGGWVYRVNLIQSSLPYLLKDILTQAGVDVFQVELNDISINQASLESLSFKVDVINSDKKNQTIKVSLHNVQLQYQYQSLLKGRLDKVVIGQAVFSAMNSPASNAVSPTEITGLVESSDKDKEEIFPVILKENINRLRNNWRSLIPLDMLTVGEIIFQGALFSVLRNYEFELAFNATENNMQVDLVGNDGKDLHAIEISSQVRDEWQFSLGKSKAAWLKLRLMDESIMANYFVDAEKVMIFLKQNNLGNMSNVAVSGSFNGAIKFYFNAPFSNDNKHSSSFVVHADQLDVSGDGVESIHLSNMDMNLSFQYEWLNNYKELAIQRESYVSFSRFSYAETQLVNTPLYLDGALQIKSGDWFYDGTLSVASLTIKKKISDKKDLGQTLEVAFKNVSTNIIADSEQIKVSGTLQPAVVPAVISYKLNHKIMTGEGSLQLQTDEALNLTNEKSMSQLLKPWLYPFDVFSGEIDFDTRLQWHKTKALQMTIRTRLKNVGGVFNELVFSGLNTKQNVALLPVMETMRFSEQSRIGQTGLIKLDYIDAGILISGLSVQLVLGKPVQGSLAVFEVHNFNANLLGGHFSSQNFTLDFNKPVNKLLVRVSQLDLSRVAETQQFSGLEIEGSLDGELPIEVSEEGVFVREGLLHNAGRQGVIRYQPGNSVEQIASNPLSAIALKALHDFRYDKLSAKLSYVPDGSLSVGLEMSGLSPELGNGRNVNLNINTEQNLKSLLKSIRFSQGLSDSIDKRVRQKYSATQ